MNHESPQIVLKSPLKMWASTYRIDNVKRELVIE